MRSAPQYTPPSLLITVPSPGRPGTGHGHGHVSSCLHQWHGDAALLPPPWGTAVLMAPKVIEQNIAQRQNHVGTEGTVQCSACYGTCPVTSHLPSGPPRSQARSRKGRHCPAQHHRVRRPAGLLRPEIIRTGGGKGPVWDSQAGEGQARGPRESTPVEGGGKAG